VLLFNSNLFSSFFFKGSFGFEKFLLLFHGFIHGFITNQQFFFHAFDFFKKFGFLSFFLVLRLFFLCEFVKKLLFFFIIHLSHLLNFSLFFFEFLFYLFLFFFKSCFHCLHFFSVINVLNLLNDNFSIRANLSSFHVSWILHKIRSTKFLKFSSQS